MNNKERLFFEERFTHIEKKLNRVHDDVLILKTQRDTSTKFIYVIAGFISLIISFLFK